MQFPQTNDTILAVASGWQPSPCGIVRLSGPRSFALVAAVGLAAPHPAATRTRPLPVRLKLDEVSVPADAFFFRAPRSYTGQDLVELHTIGSLPLLRELCGRLLTAGARRALPGEFTARAFLAGKLTPAQVENVLELLGRHRDHADRQVRRAQRQSRERLLAELRTRLLDLLTLVEAGIDFADEEDVRLVTPAEVCATLDDLPRLLAEFHQAETTARRADLPHLALAGRPNAGKSALFNALIGSERAIVSPVLGTTRDVLSAELDLDGVTVLLQDCAGLGEAAADLELAAHHAAERAAAQADLVLWVHSADAPWTDAEQQTLAHLAAGTVLNVTSKIDLVSPARPPAAGSPTDAIEVSAALGIGLETLRKAIRRRLLDAAGGTHNLPADDRIREVVLALRRARSLLSPEQAELEFPELLALELRAAYEQISELGSAALVDELLGRIFCQFCIGK